MRLVISLLAVLGLGACAHGLKEIGDLSIGKVYNLKKPEQYNKCTVQASNIVTVAPSEIGPIPLLQATQGQASAMICGNIDCSAYGPQAKAAFECLPFEFIKD